MKDYPRACPTQSWNNTYIKAQSSLLICLHQVIPEAVAVPNCPKEAGGLQNYIVTNRKTKKNDALEGGNLLMKYAALFASCGAEQQG